MISRQHKWALWSEVLLAWLVLLVLLYYVYLLFVRIPYIGFGFEASSGEIGTIYANHSTYDLRRGDRLLAVNGIPLEAAENDLRLVLFPESSSNEHLLLHIQREGENAEVQWPVPGFNSREFSSRLQNSWWLGYLFWMAGLATLLLVRPLDSKRRLFAAFFLLTALWLVSGNVSHWGHGNSRIFYRIAVWLSAPVLLHLHWLFPRPLGHLPRFLLWGIYGVTALIVLLQWLQRVPSAAHAAAYAVALLGSFFLLGIHYLRQPDVRPHVRLLLFALFFAILPVAGVALSFALRSVPPLGPFALLALPIIPGAYFYSIYRYQLGGTEFRANRLIAVYLFLILIGTLLPVVTTFLSMQPAFVGGAVLMSTVAGLAIALVTLYGFPPFQRLVERWLLAMPLPPAYLIDTYLTRITTTLNEHSLVHLLKDEVLPTLLIRQSALLRIQNNQATPIYTTGEELRPAILADLLAHLKQNTVYRAPTSLENPEESWVRVALALQVEEKLIGLWLLGRHDPDDSYSPVEIATLQNLARQSALALANIEQSTQLQALYQANIERQEVERMKLAHVLHDAILNQAAVLYMSLDASALTERADNAYQTLKDQIHQMIGNLRPPSLDLGLNAALEELAGELDQRHPSIRFVLRLTISTAGVHYPSHIENHIFRIVQQACENAFRHAHAQLIQISGTLAPDHIDLLVEDDGVGFVLAKPLDLASLLAHKHFGLVHMVERAEHINAQIELESTPGQGTRVRLTWLDDDRVGD